MTTAVNNSSSYSQEILNSLGRSNSTDKASTADEQSSRFLRLLTTQLQNQDPLNPMDNAQTTSQLAQISTVDGIERLNSTIGSMMSTFKSSEAYQAAALVGRQVLVGGNQLQLQEGLSLGGVDLAGDADHVYVSIFDKTGTEVDRVDLGVQKKGSNTFIWDGKLSNGTQLADGKYTIKVAAENAGKKVEVSSLEMATVASVVNSSDSVGIEVGRFGLLSLSDIKRIL